jgi:hypothetical protein
MQEPFKGLNYLHKTLIAVHLPLVFKKCLVEHTLQPPSGLNYLHRGSLKNI